MAIIIIIIIIIINNNVELKGRQQSKEIMTKQTQ